MDGRLSIRDARELGIEWIRPAIDKAHAHSVRLDLICIQVGPEPLDQRDPDQITYFDADYPGGIKIPIGRALAIHGITVTRNFAMFEPYRGLKPGTEEFNKGVLEAQRATFANRPRTLAPTEKTALGKDRVPVG